ncbi:SDR family oxidoreductase [Polyangium jinanense]|uniref:SDR family oxidoreductase n=1 Tax=Polyangium jinanense TaxID=2829994 RepID=A0A9X3X4N9_9BACT|nr:SDR family oxidoreductase [Polyangium jinanense]MDC3953901.1 SDR family oxidoreductase [Polyangium jinanense]MDC3957886.1 SDR family oxidoreductase [Polyangium jinanense]MDC3978972.1 SDR family oxidoreductase [Polyangium jinanense]MDC3982143.1 SDR family oxidoreductase [Polyangium jinanense]
MKQAAKKDPKDLGQKPPFPAQEQEHPGAESGMQPRADHGETSYRGLGRLKDRIALITGADSGIGRAVAIAYAREGADVGIAYLSEHEDANETKRLVEEAGQKAALFPGDLSSDTACKKLVEDAVKAFGRIDILVNNAAEQGKAVETFEELDAERVERTFRVNILAMFHIVRHALPHMKPGSVIINTASIQSYQPSPEILDYAATKGAIVTFSKGLAQGLIERGIRVNTVAPGPVWTPLVVQSFPANKNARFGENSPMERPAQPAELAPAYVFLASNESSYVNGEVLGVTGGKPLG